MKRDCCNDANCNCNVTVKVDVARIVCCLCVAAVLIVAIIFGSKNVKQYINISKKDS
jgi:hypothetical protein